MLRRFFARNGRITPLELAALRLSSVRGIVALAGKGRGGAVKIVAAVFRIIVGAVFGLASGLALAPALAAFSDKGSTSSAWVMLAIIAIGANLGLTAPTIRRAFGRGFLVSGLCVLALPISTMLLSGRIMSDMSPQLQGDAARMAGAGIGATLMTGVAGFFGFFVGAILIIIGLVLALGGRREVIIVERRSEPA